MCVDGLVMGMSQFIKRLDKELMTCPRLFLLRLRLFWAYVLCKLSEVVITLYYIAL